MRIPLSIVTAALLAVGCEDRSAPVMEPAAEAAATSQPVAAPDVTVDSPTKPLPLAVIPFVADAPESWAVQSAMAGRIVLHGVLSSGEIDVLLSQRPNLTGEAFTNLLNELKGATTQSTGEATRILTRDDLTIIETSKRFDSPGRSAAETLVAYNVKYLVPGPSLDYLVYELNIADLSQEMFEKDGELVRKVLLGLKFDGKPAEQTP